MRAFTFLLVLGLILNIPLSAQFTDNFSDGDFTNNPSWFGIDSCFEVIGQELHLNAPSVSATTYLSTNSYVINTATWIFKVRMEFNPSSSNHTRVYLMSDNSDLSSSLEGYFVEIGGNNDEISLHRQDGSSDTKIIDGTDDAVDTSDVTVRVKVERDASGLWTLSYDLTGNVNYVQDGTVLDNTYNVSLYAGVYCKYTSTRSDKFYFDDFSVSGQVYQDNTPPTLTSINVLSNTQLDLKFSENIKKNGGENTNNYSVNNAVGSPTSAVFNATDSSRITLSFSNAFANGTVNTLSLSNLEDNMGNVMSNTDQDFVYFIPVAASFKDIVINEIFADPTPQIGLPAGEFIEIYNASNNVFDMDGWYISDGSSNKSLGSHILIPGEHLILCAEDDTFDYRFYGDVIGLSWNTLTNGGDDIYLYDPSMVLIDEVHYEDSWYGDANKEDGGYSLELINPDHPCQSPSNWHVSDAFIGGTPGSQNSLFDNSPDQDGPSIEKINIVSNNEIQVLFSEAMDSISITNATYDANNGLNVLFVSTSGPYYNSVDLTFTTAFQNNVIYTLEVNNAKDCSGNNVGSANTGNFVLPDTAIGNEIVINEILFNPVGTASDYVELHNRSNKYIDLKDWKIASLDELNAIAAEYNISTSTYVLYPGDFALISKNSQSVLDQYPYTSDSNFIQLSTMPTYSNESGTVAILDQRDTVMDAFSYHEDYHFNLLDSYDGVSLERLDYDRPTQDPTNWTSASENSGFGTPGYKNSQTQVVNFTGDRVQISPEVFSPDNDGYEDLTNISYELADEGMVGNITIYDDAGRVVKYLVTNELLGQSGTYAWDGTNEIGEKAKVGIHIVFVEVFDIQGNVEHFKKSCVVSHKIN